MRWLTLIAAAALATVATATAAADIVKPKPTPLPQNATPVYSVQPDLRKCASPMCGGYWLSEVNRLRSKCADGTMQASCYVAELRFPTGKRPAAERAADVGTLLARGRLVQGGIDAFPTLGHLTVAGTWVRRGAPVGTANTSAVYEVRTTKIRCVADPCMTLLATRPNTTVRVMLSEVDLGALPPAQRVLADKALRTYGLLARGKVHTLPDEGPAGDGRSLVVETYFQRI